MDTIYKRYSVRKYLKEGLSSRQQDLMDHKINAIKEQGLFGNEITIHLIKPNIKQFKLSYGRIQGMAGYMYGYVEKTIKGYIDYGYVMEKKLLEMTKKDIGTCWLGGTYNKNYFNSIDEVDNKSIPAVISYGRNKKKKDNKTRKRKVFEDMFFEDELDKPLILNKADKLYPAFEALRLAPSALNKQPWRLVKKDSVIHFYQYIKKQEFNISNIDMGIGIAHFEYGLNINNVPYKWFKGMVEGTSQYMYHISVEIC
ncbi:nitroreductase family protein [Vallitalea maricola]|uniref:Nitroreductase family protein n=1 Tax=Vallitalea maricola TaxID=3074433 RepID=A0ACB5UKF6_9FIRM|nr:nitroreductase family protein [Vallitalea sp. AN17-2]